MLNKDTMILIFDKLLYQSKKFHDEFNISDGKIGDGDLGVTILNGIQEINDNTSNFNDDLGNNFMICAKLFVKKSGSSFGTLIAFAFMNVSKKLKGKSFASHDDIVELIEISLSTILERGKSNLGDKTIADTLNLILLNLKKENIKPNYSKIFKQSTEQAINNFKGKKILIGRARMFEDKTKDLNDPGMYALNKLAEAF
jgi:dihydroxyacetone kinase-like protein